MSITRDTSERRQQISALVRKHGSVQVAPLAERFGVSMQTIRKDLHFLTQRGVMERSYGGAISSSAITPAPIGVANEPAVEAKRAIHTEEKQRIGQLAATMVAPGDSIVLDSGTTALQIAHYLPDDVEITVVTNDFDVLAALVQKPQVKIVMLGGVLRRKNMAFYGAQTVNALDDIHVDKLFLGVDGFDIERGITTHYEPEALLNRKMVDAARHVIVVGDRSKFDRVCLHRIISVAEIDALVTDGPAPDHIRAASDQLGFALHLA